MRLPPSFLMACVLLAVIEETYIILTVFVKRLRTKINCTNRLNSFRATALYLALIDELETHESVPKTTPMFSCIVGNAFSLLRVFDAVVFLSYSLFQQ